VDHASGGSTLDELHISRVSIHSFLLGLSGFTSGNLVGLVGDTSLFLSFLVLGLSSLELDISSSLGLLGLGKVVVSNVEGIGSFLDLFLPDRGIFSSVIFSLLNVSSMSLSDLGGMFLSVSGFLGSRVLSSEHSFGVLLGFLFSSLGLFHFLRSLLFGNLGSGKLFSLSNLNLVGSEVLLDEAITVISLLFRSSQVIVVLTLETVPVRFTL
jgi:hypothetical protein